MGLPWARLDVNIGTHDKILNLFSDPSPKKWQAFSSYTIAIGWSVGHGTDGHVPRAALTAVFGTTVTARLLEKYRLWEEATAGWHIVNFEERQELTIVSEMKQVGRQLASAKANCVRHHGKDCGCWQAKQF
jgi:hypothetical protein